MAEGKKDKRNKKKDIKKTPHKKLMIEQHERH